MRREEVYDGRGFFFFFALGLACWEPGGRWPCDFDDDGGGVGFDDFVDGNSSSV